MSSALLYLAIVGVWACVLVPMWLRADTSRSGLTRLLHRVSGGATGDGVAVPSGSPLDSAAGFPHGDADEAAPAATPAGPEAPGEPVTPAGWEVPDEPVAPVGSVTLDESGLSWRSPYRRGGRAAVIARRRRRTCGLGLLLFGSMAAVSGGLGPWWVALPPVGLLAGHLSLLRVAVGMDVAHRRALALERADAQARVDALAAQQAAEVIDLLERNRSREVFDQYADPGLRAVGD